MLLVSPAEMQTDGFDVFAEREAVGAKIHAIANRLMRVQTANFDRVGLAAGGLDAEIGKNDVLRISVRDGKRLLTSALATLIDFVCIGRAPVVDWWQLKLSL